jgi:transcription-repair coupling factor (superfamily II helicase)
MNLTPLRKALGALPAYQRIVARVSEGRDGPPVGLPRAARLPVAAALAEHHPAPLVILVSRADRWLVWTEELTAWLPDAELRPFPEPTPLFYEPSGWGPRTLRQRAQALSALSAPVEVDVEGKAGRRPPIVVATARATMIRTLPPDEFRSRSFVLSPGQRIDLTARARGLLGLGYLPSSLVLEPGQMSRRGGILDLWPPPARLPIRIELEGDRIETLREFDPDSQRSAAALAGIRVIPAREALPLHWRPGWASEGAGEGPTPEELTRLEFHLPRMTATAAGLLDYVPAGGLVVFDDRSAWEEIVLEMEEQAVALRRQQIAAGVIQDDFPVPYLSLPELSETLSGLPTLDLGLVSTAEYEDRDLGSLFSPGPRYGGQVRSVLDALSRYQTAHETVVVVSRQADRLRELWERDELSSSTTAPLPDDLLPGEVHILTGALSEGWTLESETTGRLHLLTDAEIFGWVKPRPRIHPSARGEAPETAYADLRPGDWVVHVDHGIARFAGLVARSLDGLAREFLHLQYAEGDELFVPIHQADRVMRYLGADGLPPQPSRLGSADWEKAKDRARTAVEEIARELLSLYARRLAVQGFAFSSDGNWQRELEASFPYEETEDQLGALEAVKRDMETARPMDRLICGDAGYGKTEVALRAAFKAVLDGKQVAVLVPTTVLAQQHLRTFRQRLGPFPVEVEMLSRFRTQAEIDVILDRLARGEVDIVIGTHRLLQKDVRFHDLGLVVIDEEQRFGVAHKEALKRMRTEVDVLTMTATPIPRTLYMALTGVRDVSTINTPPEERVSVVTHVGPYDPRLIRQAVLRELDRGGQVFYVHNRVQTIDAAVQRLARLVPEARLGVAHGQMPEEELARVMDQFSSGELDVLVSTSIIESGLDIPNSNTLVVEQGDTFGLAQLYQLRGRVGRSAARGYAYFFRHPRFRASPEGLERLETLAEHSQLGAGYSLAMRDLEMRGAGDILGTRQHGHIAAIGFHLYTRLLAQAVHRMRSQEEGEGMEAPAGLAEPVPMPAAVELPLPSAIPADYIADRDLRLQIYRRLADIRVEKDLEALAGELADRFGPPPPEVENLLYQLQVKVLAADADVEGISSENGQILIQIHGRTEGDLPDLGGDVRWSKRGLWLARAGRAEWRERLLEVLQALGTARSAARRVPARPA